LKARLANHLGNRADHVQVLVGDFLLFIRSSNTVRSEPGTLRWSLRDMSAEGAVMHENISSDRDRCIEEASLAAVRSVVERKASLAGAIKDVSREDVYAL